MPDIGSAPNKSFQRTDGVRTGDEVWQEAKAAPVKIRSDHHDAHDTDMGDAIDNRLMRDGGNMPTGAINWNEQRITNYGNPTARTDVMRVQEVQDNEVCWGGTAGGTADALTLDFTPNLTAYATGMRIAFKASADNTGSATVNGDGVGAATLKKAGSTNLAAGDIKNGVIYEALYDGTNFQLQGRMANWAELDRAQTFTQDQTISADETLLTLTRTANDTSSDRLVEARRGSGAGTKGYIEAVGDNSNGVDALRFGAGDADVLDVHKDYVKSSKQAYSATTTLTDEATISWNLEDNQIAKVTLGGNRTLGAPTNMKDGASYLLRIIQDGTGSRTLSFNAAYKFPFSTDPTLSTGAGDVDVLVCHSDGSSMFCRLEQDFG